MKKRQPRYCYCGCDEFEATKWNNIKSYLCFGCGFILPRNRTLKKRPGLLRIWWFRLTEYRQFCKEMSKG